MNCTNNRGQSALHLASKAALGDVVIWLTGKTSRALINLRDANGTMAIDYAKTSGVRLEVIEKMEQAAGGGYKAPPYNKVNDTYRNACAAIAPGTDPATEFHLQGSPSTAGVDYYILSPNGK